MRILVVHPGPNFSVQDVHDGWVEGFEELGHEVQSYNLGDRLTWAAIAHLGMDDGTYIKAFPKPESVYSFAISGLPQACLYWWPQVIVFISGFTVDPQFLEVCRGRGIKTACVMTESPYEESRQLLIAPHFDAVALNDPTNIEQYSTLTTAVYTPHAYRSEIHHEGEAHEDYLSDCVFVGTGYPSRVAFLERCNFDGIDLALAGNWQNVPTVLADRVVHDIEDCIDNVQTAELYRGAKTSFNLYRTENNGDISDGADGWSVGPREIELAASGTWFARQSRGESDELFPMLPTFNSPEELGELIRWALENPVERQIAAEQAKRVVTDRTFPNNARKLLEACGLVKEEAHG
jgi:spore maturation protein CgeB